MSTASHPDSGIRNLRIPTLAQMIREAQEFSKPKLPSVFPSTCARSMYSPFNKLKYGQFSSYYDRPSAPA